MIHARPKELDVRRNQNQALPMHDYRLALQRAVAWLDDRYLLAEPARRLPEERKPFFSEIRRWLPSTRR
jgi:hypothetical protein